MIETKFPESKKRYIEEAIDYMIKQDLSFAEIEKWPGMFVAAEISEDMFPLGVIERKGKHYFVCLG